MISIRSSSSVHRRGFSLVECIVAVSILLIVLAIFVPYLLKVREDNNRLRCFDNLRTIGAALAEYAKSNGGDYPRVVYDAAVLAGGYSCYSGADSPNPFAKDSSVYANDVTASLWLLIRMKLAQPVDFICPSSDGVADTFTDAAGEASAIEYRSNFRDPQNLSYSYACPFSAARDYRFNSDRLGSDFAVLADKNPGVGDGSNVTGPAVGAPALALAAANSTNHGRAGQNVLYADGHAEFRTTPYCGVDGDNIYTAQAATPLSGSGVAVPADGVGVLGQNIGPARSSDSYLVPTESDVSSESVIDQPTPPSVGHPHVATPSKPARAPVVAAVKPPAAARAPAAALVKPAPAAPRPPGAAPPAAAARPPVAASPPAARAPVAASPTPPTSKPAGGASAVPHASAAPPPPPPPPRVVAQPPAPPALPPKPAAPPTTQPRSAASVPPAAKVAPAPTTRAAAGPTPPVPAKASTRPAAASQPTGR